MDTAHREEKSVAVEEGVQAKTEKSDGCKERAAPPSPSLGRDPGQDVREKHQADQDESKKCTPAQNLQKKPQTEGDKSSQIFLNKNVKIKVRCFKCSICGEQFGDGASCIAHVNSHRKEKAEVKMMLEKRASFSTKKDVENRNRTEKVSSSNNTGLDIAETTEKKSSPIQKNADSASCMADIQNLKRDKADITKTCPGKQTSSSIQAGGTSCINDLSSHDKERPEDMDTTEKMASSVCQNSAGNTIAGEQLLSSGIKNVASKFMAVHKQIRNELPIRLDLLSTTSGSDKQTGAELPIRLHVPLESSVGNEQARSKQTIRLCVPSESSVGNEQARSKQTIRLHVPSESSIGNKQIRAKQTGAEVPIKLHVPSESSVGDEQARSKRTGAEVPIRLHMPSESSVCDGQARSKHTISFHVPSEGSVGDEQTTPKQTGAEVPIRLHVPSESSVGDEQATAKRPIKLLSFQETSSSSSHSGEKKSVHHGSLKDLEYLGHVIQDVSRKPKKMCDDSKDIIRIIRSVKRISGSAVPPPPHVKSVQSEAVNKSVSSQGGNGVDHNKRLELLNLITPEKDRKLRILLRRWQNDGSVQLSSSTPTISEQSMTNTKQTSSRKSVQSQRNRKKANTASSISTGNLLETSATSRSSSSGVDWSSNEANSSWNDKANSGLSASTNVSFSKGVKDSSIGPKTVRSRTIIVFDGDIPQKYEMLANAATTHPDQNIQRETQQHNKEARTKMTEMEYQTAQLTPQVHRQPSGAPPSVMYFGNYRSQVDSRADVASKNVNTTTTATGDTSGCPKYVCCICHTEFVSFGTCRLHMKTVHGTTAIRPDVEMEARWNKNSPFRYIHEENSQMSGKGPKLFMCSLCSRQFMSLEECNAHMASYHTDVLKQKRREAELEQERISRKRKHFQPMQIQDSVAAKKSRGSHSLTDKLSYGQLNVDDILQICNSVLQQEQIADSVQRMKPFVDENQLQVTVITVDDKSDRGGHRFVKLDETARKSAGAERIKENLELPFVSGSECAPRSADMTGRVTEKLDGSSAQPTKSNLAGWERAGDSLTEYAGSDKISRGLEIAAGALTECVSSDESEGVGENVDESGTKIARPPDDAEMVKENTVGSGFESTSRSCDAKKKAKKASYAGSQIPYSYMCSVCSQKFCTLEECYSHMKSTHSGSHPEATSEQRQFDRVLHSQNILNKFPGAFITYACSACMQKFSTNEECTDHIKSIHPSKEDLRQQEKRKKRRDWDRKKRERRALRKQRKREEKKLIKQKKREEKKLKREKYMEYAEKRKMRDAYYISKDLGSLNDRDIMVTCGFTDQPKCYDCSRYSDGLDEWTQKEIMAGIVKKKDWIKDKMKGKEVRSLFYIQNYFECCICGEAYRYRVHYKRHMQRHSDNICPMCNMPFQNLHALVNHVGIHNCGPLRCEKCSETFYSSRSLGSHLLAHDEVFRCDTCKETFSSGVNLKRHKLFYHAGKKKLKCDRPDCEASFFTPALLKDHITHVHENERKHICHVCGEIYKCHRYLRLHMSVHENTKYVCEECKCWFQEESQLSLHKKRVHSTTDGANPRKRNTPLWKKYTFKRKRFNFTGPVFRCVFCREAFGNLSLWKAHVEQHRDAENGLFRCGQCHLQFTTYECLQEHSDEHLKLTLMHGCQWCSQVFPNEEDLQGHKCSKVSSLPAPPPTVPSQKTTPVILTPSHSSDPIHPPPAVKHAPESPALGPTQVYVSMREDADCS